MKAAQALEAMAERATSRPGGARDPGQGLADSVALADNAVLDFCLRGPRVAPTRIREATEPPRDGSFVDRPVRPDYRIRALILVAGVWFAEPLPTVQIAGFAPLISMPGYQVRPPSVDWLK